MERGSRSRPGHGAHVAALTSIGGMTVLGKTATFSTFSDAQFDEATFDAQLMGKGMDLIIAWYRILKLKARFLSGNYGEDLVARRPDGFGHFPTLPLPDVEGAVRQIEHSFDTLHADGVILLGNHAETYL
jgi:hypothetical protein